MDTNTEVQTEIQTDVNSEIIQKPTGEFDSIKHYENLSSYYEKIANDPILLSKLSKNGKNKSKHHGIYTKKQRNIKEERKKEKKRKQVGRQK